ncbi:hypothetical protein RhiirA1_530731 [Rhizophagus irregularis]|uniref:FIST domain-containing protein n=1 Tax=Rhizophagus irregularis TaxID=588596 RepID=A0A2N0SBW4_9GLOM|nr:hypothetical protein RhiirA1_530731 [Rhizophagus irregularis]
MTLLNLIRNLNRSSNFNPLLTNFKKQSFNSFNDSKKLLTTLSASHISIKEAIDTLSESSPKEYDVCLVFVSRTYELKDIEIIPQYLYSKFKPKFLGGCVVDKIYNNNNNNNTKNNNGHGISLLLGNWKNFSGFCTNIKGPKHQFKSNSVGRWKSLDDIKNDNESFDLFDINKFKSISSVPNEFDLPEELKILKNKNINPDLIFLVSDSEPYQFLESLDHHFPTSKKIGIIRTSTPFLTGQPFSLFHNNNIFSRGTIGVALTAESPNEFKNQFQIEHPSLSTIGDPLKITSCRGNIILKLDGTNPTKLLLDKLQFVDDKNFLSKETELYIGLYNSDNKENQLDESTLIVYKISSGDPVKGNLAVDTMMDLKEGQFVKLFYKKNEPDTILLQNKLKDQDDETQIILTMTDQDTMDSTSLLRLNNNKNIFGATSENGIIIGKGKNENTWVCNVPYSTASLLLSK